MEGGPARRVGSRAWFNLSLGQWLPNSRGLISLAGEQLNGAQIWYVSYPEGDARRITNDLNSYSSLSINGNASALVAVMTAISCTSRTALGLRTSGDPISMAAQRGN